MADLRTLSSSRISRAVTSIGKSKWSSQRPPEICVIGAGFSGLICAQRLSDEGMNVTIVEGRNRVGGRVHQEKILGHWTDMGANWIHGPEDNPIRKLAGETGVVIADPEENSSIYDEIGSLVPKARSKRLWGMLWSTIEEAFEYSLSGIDISPRISLKDFVEEHINQSDNSAEDKKVILQMSHLWGGYIGTPYERQSLKYLFLESSLEGGNVFIASTYKKILDSIALRTAKRTNIRLNTVVHRIVSDKSVIRQSVESIKLSADEISANGPTERQVYDATVVTVPLGSLRGHQVSFRPCLPSEFVHAIDSISYGNLEKVYLRFQRAFWDTHAHPQPFYSQFLHPLYAENNHRSWDIGMITLSMLSNSNDEVNHPILLFYVYGPCGTYVTELVRGLGSEDPEYLTKLTDFFFPYFSKLPNFDPESANCVPIAARATEWQHDPMAGFGSYTNWQIDDNEEHGKPPKMALDKAIETVRQGLPERGIYFAGEHTAPFDSLGTVTGAYLSGEAVAGRVLNAFKL